jgi:hypothetical protein
VDVSASGVVGRQLRVATAGEGRPHEREDAKAAADAWPVVGAVERCPFDLAFPLQPRRRAGLRGRVRRSSCRDRCRRRRGRRGVCDGGRRNRHLEPVDLARSLAPRPTLAASCAAGFRSKLTDATAAVASRSEDDIHGRPVVSEVLEQAPRHPFIKGRAANLDRTIHRWRPMDKEPRACESDLGHSGSEGRQTRRRRMMGEGVGGSREAGGGASTRGATAEDPCAAVPLDRARLLVDPLQTDRPEHRPKRLCFSNKGSR